MINISDRINNEIKERHSTYIVNESKIDERINECTLTIHSLRVHLQNKNFLRTDEFIDNLVEVLNHISTDINDLANNLSSLNFRDDNLFICEPDMLDNLMRVNYFAVMQTFNSEKFPGVLKISSKGTIGATGTTITSFNMIIEVVMGYKKFSGKKIDDENAGGWSPYQLAFALDVNVCPYCNRNYISPFISSKGGKSRGDLDHFLSKSKYPFFSMSIYNLVICCKACNSSLKGTKEFSNNTHFNPLNSQHKFMSFDLENYKVGDESKPTEDVDIRIIVNDRFGELDENNRDRSKGSVRDLSIEDQYKIHKEDVMRLIRYKKLYNKKYEEQIRKTFIGTRVSSSEKILSMVTNFNIADDEKELANKSLSKLHTDIYHKYFEKK